jgi:hypothetical protein
MTKRTDTLTTDLLFTSILILTTFVLYTSMTAPTVLTGDAGEFQFVPYILGIAHPTGYPLYLLLGWAWSHILPVGDVAYRLNLFSAFWASIALALFYLAAREFLHLSAPSLPRAARHLSALLSALTLAVSTTFWSQALIAEVYAFNTFFVALILLLLFTWARRYTPPTPPPQAGGGRGGVWYALCLAYGLSLTHHRTIILLAPALALFTWLTVRAKKPEKPGLATDQLPSSLLPEAGGQEKPRLHFLKPAIISLLLLVLPLSLYLYIPWRALHTPYTTIALSSTTRLVLYSNTWQGFFNYVLGQTFRGEIGSLAQGLSRLPVVWDLLLKQFGLAGIALGTIGLGRLIAARRWSLLILTTLGYCALVGFNMLYQIGDIYALFTPSYILFALWLGLGAATITEGVAYGILLWRKPSVQQSELSRLGQRQLIKDIRRIIVPGVLALCFILPAALLLRNYPAVNRNNDFKARDMWQQILAQPLPAGAVLVSNDRDEMMPMWYYQYVDGRRPDLLGLFPRIVENPAYANIGGVIDNALDSERQVFTIKPMPGLGIKYRMERAGNLVRIVGPAVEKQPTHSCDAILGDSIKLLGYDQSPHSVRPGSELQIKLYWQAQQQVRQTFSSYVHLVDDEGRGVTQSDHTPGEIYYPTPLWRPGEVLVDEHNLILPAGIPVGRYYLLVGMYDAKSMKPLGAGTIAGQVAVKTEVITTPGKIEHPQRLNFDGVISLLGYDLEPTNNSLYLTLYWQAERITDANYTVFAHLLNPQGEIVTQQDGQPRGGTYPTSVWDEGEVVSDRHILPLDPALPPGKYTLTVGLYLLETGERLPLLDSSGAIISDAAQLETMELKSPGAGR